MKRISFLVCLLILVAIIVLTLAPMAFAGGYKEPATGQNPHGNYSDSGDKCKVCHAVHNAASGSQTLLRSTRAAACVYCHITGNFSIKAPYGRGASMEANYTTDYDWNHDDDHNSYTAANPNLYGGCVSCHSVHGANTIGTASKILKNDPGKAISGPIATEIDFCRDCHNKAGGNLQEGGCMYTCHAQGNTTEANISPEYYLTGRNGVTHVMTTTLTGNYGTDVAWVSSETCRKCHKEGAQVDGDSFPHYTPSAVQFLDDGYSTQNTNLDRVCLNCHTNTGNGNSYTSGVGKSF